MKDNERGEELKYYGQEYYSLLRIQQTLKEHTLGKEDQASSIFVTLKNVSKNEKIPGWVWNLKDFSKMIQSGITSARVRLTYKNFDDPAQVPQPDSLGERYARFVKRRADKDGSLETEEIEVLEQSPQYVAEVGPAERLPTITNVIFWLIQWTEFMEETISKKYPSSHDTIQIKLDVPLEDPRTVIKKYIRFTEATQEALIRIASTLLTDLRSVNVEEWKKIHSKIEAFYEAREESKEKPPNFPLRRLRELPLIVDFIPKKKTNM